LGTPKGGPLFWDYGKTGLEDLGLCLIGGGLLASKVGKWDEVLPRI